VASVYFSSDVANPDTYTKFFADLQMYNTTMPQPDPERFMNQWTSAEISTKANKWQGRNISRYQNADYDRAFTAAQSELDPVKRAALFIEMNDILWKTHAVIPIENRPVVSAHSSRRRASMCGWDNDDWLLKDWYREG
jgi:peptide/nickel transport system substrate-binding protein